MNCMSNVIAYKNEIVSGADVMVFPSRLKMLREKAGWSKTETARRLGVKSLSTYANWEYGEREPDHRTLIKMARLFNVSIDFLLGHDTYDSRQDETFFNAIGDNEFKRWMLENFSDASKEDLNKLRTMWNMLMQLSKDNQN